jgi:hypothetical protein
MIVTTATVVGSNAGNRVENVSRRAFTINRIMYQCIRGVLFNTPVYNTPVFNTPVYNNNL